MVALLMTSCSSNKKVETQAQEVVKTEVETKAEPVQEEAPGVPEVSVPAATTAELPMITGDSILDVNCALGRDQRTISLLKRTDAQGWGVVYEKFGTKKTIAIAQNDKSFCDEVVGRVKSNLQNAGFQCDGEGAVSSAPASGAEEASANIQEKTNIDKAKEDVTNAKESAGAIIDKTKEGAVKVMDKAKETVKEVVNEAKGDE